MTDAIKVGLVGRAGTEAASQAFHADDYNRRISADRRDLSASHDKTLKVWKLESGRELRTLEGHSAPVNGVALSADGKRAVSASEDKSVKV
jgi:WD40 repeat protein